MKLPKYIIVLGLLSVFSRLYGQTQSKLQVAVYFESAKFELSDSSKDLLKGLADSIKFKLKLNISVSGNTDDVGDSIFNIRLSENRSRMVRKFLIENGLDSNKIKIGFNGENKPLADNASDVGKQKNRRVDIAIKWEIPKPKEPVGDVRELMALLANPVTSYCVSPYRDTVLFSAKGTKLILLANAFGLKDVCKEGCVTIDFKDAIGQADMIFDNLTTTSNGNLLESSGMAYVNARCGKKILRIKSPNSVFLVFPTDVINDDVKVFMGQRNSEIDPMNWNLSKKDKVSTLSNIDMENYTPGEDVFHKDLKAQLLADAMQHRHKGCLGIGGTSNKKLEEMLDKRLKNLDEQITTGAYNRDGLFGPGNINYAVKNDIMWVVASVSKLGWINCDRFVNEKTQEYKINTASNSTTAAYMCLTQINSLMNGFAKDKMFVFTVPLGHKYKFVGLKYEDKKASLATLEGNTSDPSNPIAYKYFESIAELKEAIKAYLTR